MEENSKFCINCVHYRWLMGEDGTKPPFINIGLVPNSIFSHSRVCVRPSPDVKVNPVTGYVQEASLIRINCVEQRSDVSFVADRCGPEGKYFVAAPKEDEKDE